MNSGILEESRGPLFHQVPICECEGSEWSNNRSYFLFGRDVPIDFDKLLKAIVLHIGGFVFVCWFVVF